MLLYIYNMAFSRMTKAPEVAPQINPPINSPRRINLNISWQQIRRTLLFFIFGFIGLFLLVIAYTISTEKIFEPRPTDNRWQAVFLTNGQVYFGHLRTTGRYFVLKDIYYLQVPQPLQQESAGVVSANINLVKLGEELHGPDDFMYIDRDKVMFWENLKDTSKVVEAINRIKQ